MDPSLLIPGDPILIENIVNYLKSKGIFDEFRHECLADVDTKSSCQNLNQRIDGYTTKFLTNETWNQDLNKNELRNKLRRHIDESGMLEVGADHVVEQGINHKINFVFSPKITELVHQYLREQDEVFSKKSESAADSSASEKPALDDPDCNTSKVKTTISDPIADILSFSYSKTKPTSASSSHGKFEAGQQKYAEHKKKKEEESTSDKRKEETTIEKKKDESILEKIKEEPAESPSENVIANELKSQSDKEKVKKEIKLEEPEVGPDVTKKVKEEIKSDKKKTDDTKGQSNKSTVTEDNKSSTSTTAKLGISVKKEIDKSKHKSKLIDPSKMSNSPKDTKKPKMEPSDKSDKHHKSKHFSLSKESLSPTKMAALKTLTKDEKQGLISKSKSDSNSKKDSESKQKKHSEKPERLKTTKSNDLKKEHIHHDSTSSDKGIKSGQYSSSQDSSQGSDQEKTLLNTSKEKLKHFSKHVRKDSSQKISDKMVKISSDRKRTKNSDENSTKKLKTKKSSRTEISKDATVLEEAAKISSRSNSFGSTSSISSSSNASKENSTSNSDETAEKSSRDKKKRDAKEKDQCRSSKTLPPPPPPPPPSSSLSFELTSAAEVSSMEEDQSSSESEKSSNEESSEELSNDSESDSKNALLEALERYVPNSSVDDIDDFYDIFLYSSSSSEFEGYETLPEEKKAVESKLDSDVSVSSVHTSDLSSYNDELSGDEFILGDESRGKKRLTLKEAQQLIQNRVAVRMFNKNKNKSEDKPKEDSKNDFFNCSLDMGASYLSSDDELSPSETRRSLRRERKLNPRYASSEYTSIFNATKESFITKHMSPTKKIQSILSLPQVELKHKKKDSSVEKNKAAKKTSDEPPRLKSLEESIMPKNLGDNKFKKVTEEIKIQKKIKEIKPQRMIKVNNIQNISEECTLEEKSKEFVVQETSKHFALQVKSEEAAIGKKPKESAVQEKFINPSIQENSEDPVVHEFSEEITNEKISKKSTIQENSEECKVMNSSASTITQNNIQRKESLNIPEALDIIKEDINDILNLEGHEIQGYIFVSDPVDDDKEHEDSGQTSSSDEMDSIMEKEHLLQENDKTVANSVVDPLTLHVKLKSQNNSNFNINSHSVKRKLMASDLPSAKRPCSRSSVDSSSSESAANENKPFNSAKQNLMDEKHVRLNNDLKGSDLTDTIKSDLFCLQRTNNNGDLLGQKDILLNSHGKSISVHEKKSKELDTSNELNAL